MNTQNTLLTVQELADLLKLKPSWVYEHADDLGAYRLGKYVRFSLPRVIQRLEDADRPPIGVQPDKRD